MKLHASATDKLLYGCMNYGGHAEEHKLVSFMEGLLFSIYVRSQSDGIVLVESDALIKERINRNLPTHDIVPMKLHASAIKKIMEIYDMYGGHENESKIKYAYSNLDFTPYERKVAFMDTVLVLTEDLITVLRDTGRGQ